VWLRLWYRLFDRYDRPLVSLAVLGDERPTWRPEGYGYGLWGCQVRFAFPVVKLLDYQARWEALEQSRNPFAVLVMVQLKTQQTRRDPEDRMRWKLQLVKGAVPAGLYPGRDPRVIPVH
jgi:hypothetical protein